jgi:hypothetical protein
MKRFLMPGVPMPSLCHHLLKHQKTCPKVLKLETPWFTWATIIGKEERSMVGEHE